MTASAKRKRVRERRSRPLREVPGWKNAGIGLARNDLSHPVCLSWMVLGALPDIRLPSPGNTGAFVAEYSGVPRDSCLPPAYRQETFGAPSTTRVLAGPVGPRYRNRHPSSSSDSSAICAGSSCLFQGSDSCPFLAPSDQVFDSRHLGVTLVLCTGWSITQLPLFRV